jgi:hypothetical protein
MKKIRQIYEFRIVFERWNGKYARAAFRSCQVRNPSIYWPSKLRHLLNFTQFVHLYTAIVLKYFVTNYFYVCLNSSFTVI